MEKITRFVSLSVVSHGQISLVQQLAKDLQEHCANVIHELIVTINIPETVPFTAQYSSYPIKFIHNPTPLGFGANHNQAFQHATGDYFCVINPDIRLQDNPFSLLLAQLSNANIGVVAPLVLCGEGGVEDSARKFPTPLTILAKALGKAKLRDYVINEQPIYPDWVAGMFMLFRSPVYKQLGGFDDNFFLYYEDVNLCARLRLAGFEVMLEPKAQVTHLAQRESHRNFKYMRWHLSSMARFFLSKQFVQIFWRKFQNK